MIPNSKSLFSNLFDDTRITPNYLARFTEDVIAKLSQNNSANLFDIVLLPLQTAQTNFRIELGNLDTSSNVLVGKTNTVDDFIRQFSVYMRNNYIFIAVKLGGEKMPALLEFYPHKKSEYYQITKLKATVLLDRVATAAVAHESIIGITISQELQAFQTQWKAFRKSQLEEKSTVVHSRHDRGETRKIVEKNLLTTIHFIGGLYPGDVEKCDAFFDFKLLTAARHHRKTTKNIP
jgi:hypothetical protein